jgi:hypothetical protein
VEKRWLACQFEKTNGYSARTSDVSERTVFRYLNETK